MYPLRHKDCLNNTDQSQAKLIMASDLLLRARSFCCISMRDAGSQAIELAVIKGAVKGKIN